MTVNPLLIPYLNFTYPKNAPKLNQRSSFTPTPYPSRKVNHTTHIFFFFLLLNIPSDESYTVSTNREREKCQQIDFFNNKTALFIMSHAGQKNYKRPLFYIQIESLGLGLSPGAFQSLEPRFFLCNLTFQSSTSKTSHSCQNSLLPAPSPAPTHFLMPSYSGPCPLLEEKKPILFLSSSSNLAHFSKPIQIPKDSFPDTTTNSNLPSLRTSHPLLASPPTLPRHLIS